MLKLIARMLELFTVLSKSLNALCNYFADLIKLYIQDQLNFEIFQQIVFSI